MKAVNKLVVLLIVGMISAVVASASTLEDSYLKTCNKDPGVPVPVTVVSPTVGPEYQGASVQLEFLVDAAGKPSEFSIKFATDDVLATAVVKAVKQWRFQPAEIDGRPVAKRVSLPVRIVDSSMTGERYAANE
jgi:TonB family protein